VDFATTIKLVERSAARIRVLFSLIPSSLIRLCTSIVIRSDNSSRSSALLMPISNIWHVPHIWRMPWHSPLDREPSVFEFFKPIL
jgi:hypothetical protein